jgi:hypothetical protein
MKRFYYRFKNALALIGIGVTLCHKYAPDLTAGIVVLILIMLILLNKVQLEDECA